MRRLAGVALALGVVLLPSMSARADNTEVSVGETSYTPTTISIAIDETVVWTYAGSNSHSVTADDGSFDSSPTCGQLLGPCMGPSFSHKFIAPGTFTYHCRIVQGMTGTVVVDEPSTTTSTSTSTSTTSTTLASDSASTSLSSDQPTISQASLPSLPSGRVLPKSIIRAGRTEDDVRPWVFLDVGIAGSTTIIGAVLVRRGRVPFG